MLRRRLSRLRRPAPRERFLYFLVGAFVGAASGGLWLLSFPADPALTIGLCTLAFGMLAALLLDRALVLFALLYGGSWRQDR